MTNYDRGADFERTVKADLEKRGWVADRVAGSHGDADIIAMSKDTLFPMRVQCKTDGAMGPAERGALADACVRAGAIPVKASRPKRGVILYQRYFRDGNRWEEIDP